MVSELNLRTCGRAGCRWPAAASLSFRYDTRQVWLIDLAPEPHPTLYDLCPDHADALTVPRGWARVDDRDPDEPVREPSGDDLDARSGRRSEPVGVGNRYAALAAELPRLARAYGTAAPPGGSAVPAPGEARSGGAVPVPSRDLAPLPAGEAPRAPREPVAIAVPVPDHPGQLTIPIEELGGDAVVVPIDAGRRT